MLQAINISSPECEDDSFIRKFGYRVTEQPKFRYLNTVIPFKCVLLLNMYLLRL
jgi:hypothetical protein